MDPDIAETTERQTEAMRELSAKAFREPEVILADAPALIEAARALILRRALAERTVRNDTRARLDASQAA